MSAPDPFGFTTPSPSPAYSPKPHTLIAQPGQEIRIKVSDRSGQVSGGLPGDTRATRSGSGDTRATRGGYGDTRATRGGYGDTRATRGGYGDTRATRGGYGDTRATRGGYGDTEPGDAFGFVDPKQVYPDRPMTVIARPGQEIRIIVQDDEASG